MWGQTPEEVYQRFADSGAGPSPANIHNIDENGERAYGDAEPQQDATVSSTAVPSPGTASEMDGTWGERDAGGPVSHRMAMEDYEALRREMTNLSKTQSKSSVKSDGRGLSRVFSIQTRRSKATRASTTGSTQGNATESDVDREAGDAQGTTAQEEDFELGSFIKEGHFEKRTEAGESAKKVGVVYKNLTVKGVGRKATFVRTLPDAILGTFGPDLYHSLSSYMPALRFGKQEQTRDLIHDFTGVVRDGEMMLVLGRPGSGCSTFLKAIANERGSYANVTGDVHYGGISAAEQAMHYRGEVNYNPEDDQHMPTLNVWQTLKFSLLNKTRKRSKGEIDMIIAALLKMFGISHTRYTLVGNEYVRGVSGGERKRVSIAETLSTKSTVVCWDNSTRGLDASTALDYANSLRIMTDVSDRTTFVTLYQAGEGIYQLMDKVLVIDEGRMIFQGPAGEAKQYFRDLGFYCPDRQTSADFLTSVTDPTERQFREGYEDKAPRTSEDFEKAFKNSENYKKVLADVEDYEKRLEQTEHADARAFKQSVKEQKSKTVSKKSNYTVSYLRQVMACTQREFWLLLGDKTTLYTKFFIIISNGLIVGSLFHGQSLDTEGAFTRGGTAFFSIIFLGWLQLTELMKAVSGRTVIARHKEYAFYRPSAVSIARVLVDFPVLLVQVIIFSIIMYFMTGLDVSASKFFIYALFVYTMTICMTALYRMFAAISPEIDTAVRFSGIALKILIVYAGYVISKPQLLSEMIWFGWIYYINPISYAFEGVLSNELSGRVMQCAPAELVPQGPGTGPPYQGCAIAGAQLGSTAVSGSAYLETKYNYTRSHLWRNWAVIVAFAVLYILVTAVASELFSFVRGGGGALIFKRSRRAKQQVAASAPAADEEKAGSPGSSSVSSGPTHTSDNEVSALQEVTKSEKVFTWNDLEYSVPYQGGQKKLLNKISGYAKPGVMIALMGASGAGKTTLLNTLAQRQTVGIVSGNMLVDGRPLGTEFQRGTGFCEQMDLHDDTATIREAFEFSAILRQERTIPRAEKIAYVDKLIELLELGDLQDAIIMSLSVEQRKRLTIGVELAAKPSLLLFLDEPTSGLDNQSAFSIIRFLKKLAQAGQAIVCTIHQPSSILVQQFDMILALNPGGNTFYFGPVGEHGSAVIKYFKDRGVECPPTKNVAEFILETAAKGQKRGGRRINWNEEWKKSAENQQILEEIARIHSERSKVPEGDKGTQREFASPILLQTTMLTKRLFIQGWRDPSYLYGKLFVSVVVGLFNGFTFWQLGNTVNDMQNRMFTSFLILLIPPTIVNAVVPKFYQNRALWEFRELPSRIYGWVAFCTANIITEIPVAVLGATLYWALWYWPTGLPTGSSTSGYVYLMTVLFFLFQASWGQWICAFAPSFTVISNTLPFFFVIFSFFNGVVRPYSQLSVFWRSWLYYLNPSTYWVGGVLAATLDGTPVRCAPAEAAYFNPPPGLTCAQYAGDFVASIARQGYLLNPTATSACGYCAYASGTEYMAELNVKPGDKWQDLGVFAAFCVSNWGLVYFFIYTVRVRGWGFGIGMLLRGLGMVGGLVGGLLRRGRKGEGEGEGEGRAKVDAV